MQLKRVLRHAFATDLALQRAFNPEVLSAIERTIEACEQHHGGEIRFAVEGALSASAVWSSITPRDRALQVFAQLNVWDTAANNGVLIYLLWADRDIEIVADRSLNDRVSAGQWARICERMEQMLAAGAVHQACVETIQAVSELLAKHFPGGDRNDLPNRAVML